MLQILTLLFIIKTSKSQSADDCAHFSFDHWNVPISLNGEIFCTSGGGGSYTDSSHYFSCVNGIPYTNRFSNYDCSGTANTTESAVSWYSDFDTDWSCVNKTCEYVKYDGIHYSDSSCTSATGYQDTQYAKK